MGPHRPTRAGIRRLGHRVSDVAAVAGPIGIAVLWVPLRDTFPNVDVALALVLAVTAGGASGRRWRVVTAAVGAAAGFAYFDTRPYERFIIARQPDVETLAVLFVVSLVTGELAVRVARQRSGAATEGAMLRVRQVAALVASGEELCNVLGAVSGELGGMLGASGCTYEAGASPPNALVVCRDGRLRRSDTAGRQPVAHDDLAVIELPVTGIGQVLGRFVLTRPARRALGQQRLLVALTLADQVGAALIAQAPQSVGGDLPSLDTEATAPRPTLRVVD